MSLYGGSYYGLLAFSDTDGVVHDASATVNASATLANVDWIVTMGSGPFTLTATSSSTCSGEVVIIERSDKFAYGSGLYSSNEYDDADLQTIVSATSSVASVSGVRVQNGSATATSSSTTASDAEKIYQGSAISSASSSTTASSVFVASSGGSLTATSGTTVDFIRERNSNALVSTTSGTLAIGREKWEVIPPTSTTWTIIAA